MLHVHFLPALATPADLAGGLVVVIDVLRASTTICHALAVGARAVIPCLEVDAARQRAASLPPGQAVLGGERMGLRIEGFDLGNSPGEYGPASVGGRTVIFTTTNGTRAMQKCRQAARVVIGGFVNLSAICREVKHTLDARSDAHLLCAGTRGEITGEDVLLAGAVAQGVSKLNLATRDESQPLMNDQAHLAELAWHALAGDGDTISPAELSKHMAQHTRGGRNVTALGLAADILAAATIDRFDFVPELRLSEWQIVR